MRRAFYIAAKLLPECSDSWLRQATRRYVICPFYHAISDTPLPHITPLYRHRTEKEFRADIEWLLAHYKPIHWYEIDAYESAKEPAFCLSFDDGLKEFYTIVAPILEEKNVPCVCFVNSAFVDNKDLMFRYKDALTRTGIDWKQFLHDEQPYLTYKQISELQARGFEFGSHSMDHPYFDRLTLNEQLTQTLTCADTLKKHKVLTRRIFSFPFGQGGLESTALHVHEGLHEAIFGTANLRQGGRNMYNRISIDGTGTPIRDIIRGEYIRELAHQILHD